MLNLRRTFPTKAIRVISLAPHLGPNNEEDGVELSDQQQEPKQERSSESTADETRQAALEAGLFEMVSLLADESDGDPEE